MTNRADRGLELFASLPKVSAEDFEAIKFDKPSGSTQPIHGLRG